jgi:hypothetical protein
VVGFDNTPESAYFIPPLTTIRQDFPRGGTRRGAALVDQLRTGTKRQERVVIDPALVCRESSVANPSPPVINAGAGFQQERAGAVFFPSGSAALRYSAQTS